MQKMLPAVVSKHNNWPHSKSRELLTLMIHKREYLT